MFDGERHDTSGALVTSVIHIRGTRVYKKSASFSQTYAKGCNLKNLLGE